MAARGRLRLSRDGGRNYPRRGERPVTTALPNQPAALLLYDQHGCAPTLCLDLDVAKGSHEAVDRDAKALGRLLRSCGLRWFSDHSPTGGRHLYIPLEVPVPFHDAVDAIRALAARTPTLDPMPMLGLTDGCLRPPGARHRTGGHQQLDGPLHAAQHVLQHPNSSHAWDRLTHVLQQPLTPAQQHPSPAATTSTHASIPTEPAASGATTPVPAGSGTSDAVGQRLQALSGHGTPDANYQRIARTGDYDTTRYQSPSEARQAVMWSAAAAGWSFTDVTRRLEDGTWPGLAALYARYRTHHRRQAIAHDWHHALSFEKHRRQHTRNSHVHQRTTSQQQTHRGCSGQGAVRIGSAPVGQAVREWLTAVDLLAQPGEELTDRTVLYALAEAAVLTDSLTVEHGNRSLAVATGLDQSTVGRILHRLLDAPTDRSLIDLVRPAHGVRAHTYLLRIPPLLQHASSRRPWRRGRIHAVRPAFRVLGLPAAFTYAALEQHDQPLSVRNLAERAHLSIRSTYEAIDTLAAWGLATHTPHGWSIGTASLSRLAEQLGIDDTITQQIERYRSERRAWWQRLGIIRLERTHLHRSTRPPPPSPAQGHPQDGYPLRSRTRAATPEKPTPPGRLDATTATQATNPRDDATAQLIEMLHDRLGATPITA